MLGSCSSALTTARCAADSVPAGGSELRTVGSGRIVPRGKI
jgi:hypothetical protein